LNQTPAKSVDVSSQDVSSPSAKKGKKPTKQSKKATKWWVRDLQLTQDDKKVLESDEWLNDAHMDAVNKLVAEQLGSRHQSTIMSQSQSSFDTGTGDTIQILHDVNHWVVVAFLCDTVYLAVSMNRKVLSDSLVRQIK